MRVPGRMGGSGKSSRSSGSWSRMGVLFRVSAVSLSSDGGYLRTMRTSGAVGTVAEVSYQGFKHVSVHQGVCRVSRQVWEVVKSRNLGRVGDFSVVGVVGGESRGVPSVLLGGLLFLEVLFGRAALSHDVVGKKDCSYCSVLGEGDKKNDTDNCRISFLYSLGLG